MTNPAAPALAGRLLTKGPSNAFSVQGGYAYFVSTEADALQILDLGGLYDAKT